MPGQILDIFINVFGKGYSEGFCKNLTNIQDLGRGCKFQSEVSKENYVIRVVSADDYWSHTLIK